MLGFAFHLWRFLLIRKKLWKECFQQLEPDTYTLKRINQLSLFAAAGAFPHCLLRGYPASKLEMRSLALFGAATALADDLTDEDRLPLSRLVFLATNKDASANTPREEIAQKLFFRGIAEHPFPELLMTQLQIALKDQETSKAQNGYLNFEESWRISAEKGASSNLLFLFFLHHQPTDQEKKLAEVVGIALQLLDDIFDLYEDLEDGISTPITRAQSIEQITAVYTEALEDVRSRMASFSAPESKKKSAARIWRFIFKRGYIGLNQYRRFCEQTRQSFPPAQYTRHDLIVDMEKLGNLYKNFAR